MQTTLPTPIPAAIDSSPISIGTDLNVGISAFGSWMLGVGTIIGSMAWLFHSPMIARAGTLPSAIAFFIGALIALPLAIVLSELSRLVPTAGGPYVYKYMAFKELFPKSGEFFGFASGWLFWVALVAGYACMSNGFSNLLATSVFGSVAAAPEWFAPVCIVVLFLVSTTMNCLPVHRVAGINSLFTLSKFALAAGFVALVVWSGKFDLNNALQIANPAGKGDLVSNVMSVLIFGIAAYSGLELSACTSSETKQAHRNVPRAILLTLFSVAIIYIAMSIAVGGCANWACTADGAGSVVPGTVIPATCPGLAGFLGGSLMGNLFTAGVLISIIGCGVGGLLSCARIIYAIAKTGLFPRKLAVVNAQKVPTRALWFQCIAMSFVGASAAILSRQGLFPDAYTFLAEVFAFLYSFLAIFYGISLIVLRRTLGTPNASRTALARFRALVCPVAVITIYACLAFLCVNLLHQAAALILLVMGMPIYFWTRKERSSRNAELA